jgi:xanthine dehydrogenase YagS FAD-binding subunit
LATATAVLLIKNGIVQSATLMLSHVAPIPWRAKEAEGVLVGSAVTPASASSAAVAALKSAKSLGQNSYKIPVAQTALKRAILQAAGLDPLGDA